MIYKSINDHEINDNKSFEILDDPQKDFVSFLLFFSNLCLMHFCRI